MAPSPASKTARAPGANTTKHPPLRPAPSTANSGPSSTQPASSNASTSTHTTAQLAPMPVAETSDQGAESFAGLTEPDSVDSLQLPGQPYKDGRIRNPVPSKLKGKTTASSGRFSVMHMDIRGKSDLATDRDQAAKRTSENTALAAQKAYESGYQPHRKSNWLRVEDTPDPAVPFTGTTPYDPTLYGLKPASNTVKDKPSVQATGPLDAEEIKEHQARLLTLLRSLQPVQVVDQICKALAYFGGIPGAPPPQDAKFPESAEYNGPGSVFVGWLAEIFPDLDAQGKRKPRPFRAPAAPTEQNPEKRGRGRPKGSKASKARSDKGIKKGPKRTLNNEAPAPDGPDHDESWVAVDETIRDDDQDVVVTGAQTRPKTPDAEVVGGGETTASVKKRGRPKGSKNRPKDPPVDGSTASAPLSALFSIGQKTAARQVPRPKAAKVRAKDAQTDSNTATTAPINGTTVFLPPESQAAIPQPTPTMEPPSQASQMPQATPAQADSEFALAALKAFNESHPNGSETPATSFQPVNNASAARDLSAANGKKSTTKSGAKATAKANGTQPAKKRKRSSKDVGPTDPPPTYTEAIGGSVAPLTQPTAVGIQGTSAEEVTAPAPAPKKQRKTKAKTKTATNNGISLEESAVVGPSQVSQPRAVQPASATQPTDVQMYTSPTIEELEAQLEQHDEQSLPAPGGHTVQNSRQAQPPQEDPLQNPMQQIQNQQTGNVKQVQQAQQKSDQQHRVMARHRQQYQQQQQQVAARTASPNVSQLSTASPHMSVQSASPNINQNQGPAASPSLPHQRSSNSQTPTSMTSQVQSQQTGNTPYYTSQATTAAQPSFGQQQNQQYASPQPAKQQFAVPQSQQQQSYSTTQQPSQQQPSYGAQQPQYSQQKQQPYPTQPQSQYASPQQQYSSQQPVQQRQPYATSSAGSASQTLAAQSPQYGSSTASAYNSNDGNFRTNSAASMNFNSNAYNSNQSSTASRSNSVYPATATSSYGNPAQQITSSYATAPRRALPTTTSNHNPVQNVQSLPQGVNNFSDFGNLGFDGNLMSGLDNSAAGHNNMGINAASYNLGAGNVSRSSTGANNFSSDFGMRNDGNSYFGIRR